MTEGGYIKAARDKRLKKIYLSLRLLLPNRVKVIMRQARTVEEEDKGSNEGNERRIMGNVCRYCYMLECKH